MNSTKGVIRIIKLASNPNEYDEYYYLSDVSTDINSHLMARITGKHLGCYEVYLQLAK